MKPEHKTWLTRGALAVALLAVLALAWKFARPPADDGAFVRGNGRIEATEVDVAAKAAGRVAEILVNEGDFVKAGDVIAKMDTRAIDAQLAQAGQTLGGHVEALPGPPRYLSAGGRAGRLPQQRVRRTGRHRTHGDRGDPVVTGPTRPAGAGGQR